MTDVADRYAAWKAPQQDGGILIWPRPRDLLACAESNHRLLGATTANVQGCTLADLRQDFRRYLGIQDEHQLVFVAGHQTELHHVGVWAKNVLIDSAARNTGGLAVHVAVDTDAPKHLLLRTPDFSAPITDDPRAASADWAQLVAPPTPRHLAGIADQLTSVARDWSFSTCVGQVLEQFRRLSPEAENLPRLLTAGLHEFDWSLGLRYSAMLASPFWASPAYLTLLYHLMSHAEAFASDFNAALAAYRKSRGIRTPGRPMPELAVRPDRIESPFWRDDLRRGHRVRAWVERDDRGLFLSAGDDRLPLDPAASTTEAVDRLTAFLRRNELRLSPRATTLTASLRLLAADLFVHGIGGGEYDQVTDDALRRHFSIDPPRFAVTTATLYWPGVGDEKRTLLPELRHEGHQLAHRVLGDRKAEFLDAIAAAPRKSGDRSALFHRMHAALGAAARTSPAVQSWQATMIAAIDRAQQEKSLFDRERFYPLQPPSRLDGIIERYRQAMSTPV